MQGITDKRVIHEIPRHLSGLQFLEKIRISFYLSGFEQAYQFRPIGRERIGLEIDPVDLPSWILDRPVFLIEIAIIVSKRPLQYRRRVRGIFSTIFRENPGHFRAIAPGPELGFNEGVYHLLSPLFPLSNILLVNKDNATGVILPDIAGETENQNPTGFEIFRCHVERFSNDITTDALIGEG